HDRFVLEGVHGEDAALADGDIEKVGVEVETPHRATGTGVDLEDLAGSAGATDVGRHPDEAAVAGKGLRAIADDGEIAAPPAAGRLLPDLPVGLDERQDAAVRGGEHADRQASDIDAGVHPEF